MPAMVRMSEVLPAPLAPTMATIAPSSISSDTPSSAWASPWKTSRFSIASIKRPPPRRGSYRSPHAHSERHHCAHHMLYQQDSESAVPIELFENCDYSVGLGGPQASHYLVEQQQFGIGSECTCDLQALAIRKRECRGALRAFAI